MKNASLSHNVFLIYLLSILLKLILVLKALKSHVPWQIKIISKIFLSRLPIPYGFWSRISLFRHGEMDDFNYAYSVFKSHFLSCNILHNFTSLELGPGNSIFSVMVNYAFGGRTCYLVDVGNFVNPDLELYQNFNLFLKEKNLPTKDIKGCRTIYDILDIYGAVYLTEGLDSLRSLPGSSVDFIFSQAVLEHIRKKDFLPLMKELRRIVKDTGYCSHTVDLKDHLGGKLNNLRFSEKLWESNFMSRSGFYTNRIRYSEMLEMFEEANFKLDSISQVTWKSAPILRSQLAIEFRNISEEDLLTSGFSIVLKPD